MTRIINILMIMTVGIAWYCTISALIDFKPAQVANDLLSIRGGR